MRRKYQIRWVSYNCAISHRRSLDSCTCRTLAWTSSALSKEPDEQLLLVDLTLERFVGPLLEDCVGWLAAGGWCWCYLGDEDELEEEFVGLVGAGEVLECDWLLLALRQEVEGVHSEAYQ